jgi:hypothetical protein
MVRLIAVVMFALALPALALAQQPQHRGGPPGGRPGPRSMVAPHGPPQGAFRGPPLGATRGPVGAQFSYHGRMVGRVHISPFVYPQGWAYRRWAVGAVLPSVFLASAYYYADYASLGFPPPPPGQQWVRYGPDLLLVDTASGQIIEVVPGVFY